MTALPARCGNGHHFMTADVVRIPPGRSVTLKNVSTDPCPGCGADAMIEDGRYLAPANFRQRLANAWRALRGI